jgi:DNA-directed RNA polymerase subunit K/omega
MYQDLLRIISRQKNSSKYNQKEADLRNAASLQVFGKPHRLFWDARNIRKKSNNEFWTDLESTVQSMSTPPEIQPASLYERVEILCQRATQISLGAETKLRPQADAIKTATEEIEQGLIDMRIRRALPDSRFVFVNPVHGNETSYTSRFFDLHFVRDASNNPRQQK